MDAPGLDFKGFWDRFFENFRRRLVRKCVSYQQVRVSWFRLKFMAFWGSFLRCGHFTDEMPSMPKKPRTPSSKVWANCGPNVGFHFPMCLQQCSPADASLQCMAVPQHSCTQMGRRRWPPLGGVQWNWFQGAFGAFLGFSYEIGNDLK